MKRRLFEIVREGEGQDALSRWFDVFIISLIGLSVIAVMLETVDPVEAYLGAALGWFEVFCVVVFSFEYVARVYVSTEDERFVRPVLGRLRYMLTPLVLIDLLAILPFYLPFVVGDYRFLRIVRLVRLVRILKVARYSRTLNRFGNVLNRKKQDLAMAFIAVSFLLVIASSTMYFVEHSAQPEVFSSIPASLWWGVITLTTVGYGDVVPVTVLGKFLGGIIAAMGIGMFALPAGILASGFEQEIMREKRASLDRCPECGRPYEEEQSIRDG